MATDYISREDFLEQRRHLYCDNCARRKNGKGKIVYDIGDAPCRACGIGDVLDDIEDFPAADVAPVVRGKWVWNEAWVCGNPYGSYRCTACSAASPHTSGFCPNCGADMREEHES